MSLLYTLAAFFFAATGSVFYVAPPGEDEVEAPAPAAPEKDFGLETLSEGALADMFDSI